MVVAAQESVEALKLDTQSMEKEAKDIHEKMDALVAEKEKQMGSELKSLSNTVDELSKGLVQATSNWTNQKVRTGVTWSVGFIAEWTVPLKSKACCPSSVRPWPHQPSPI